MQSSLEYRWPEPPHAMDTRGAAVAGTDRKSVKLLILFLLCCTSNVAVVFKQLMRFGLSSRCGSGDAMM